jgi:hypothetical protein
MPEGPSLINLGDISKPATVLIEKISDAIGGIFQPMQMKRLAKAEVESDIIRTKGDIEVSDIQRRAMHRFVTEEAKKQANIESITEQAIPQLKDKSTPENMDDDWISNFFERSRIVSNKDMQALWSKVLAGEANTPGSFSKRTVNFLASLDKKDALLFKNLCGFVFNMGDIVPVIFDVTAPIYANAGIDFPSLNHLDTIGLIKFDSLAGFSVGASKRRFVFAYYGTPVSLEVSPEQGSMFSVGKVLLTQVGRQLVSVCESEPVAGFLDFAIEEWKKAGFSAERIVGTIRVETK